jgi:hypothetical protein
MADTSGSPSALARRPADFGDAARVAGWFSIDDRVMGGVSSSRLRYDAASHAVFEGPLSLERNGGFASVRSPPAGTWVRVDLPVAGITPSFRGRPAPSAPPFGPARVRQIGLVATNGRAGPFALSVRSIWSE